MDEAQLVEYVKYLANLKPCDKAATYKEKFLEMAVHIRRLKPEAILLKRRPNEPAEIEKYRLENFESITYGSMNRSIDNCMRIFTATNFPLNVDNEAVKEYIETRNFNRLTFMEFYKTIWFKRMLEDSNGFMFWLPGGPGFKDSSKNILAYPRLVYSYNLIDIDDEKLVIEAPDNSYLKYGEEVRRDGKIYWIFTKDSFYTYTQLTFDEYKLELVYQHNLGIFPCQWLGGDINGDGDYESFFAPFLAFGNESIRQFSDWQSLSMTAAHPIREVFHMSCEVQDLEEDDSDDHDNTDGQNNPKGKNKKYKSLKRRVALIPSSYGQIDRPVGQNDEDGFGEVFLDPKIESIRWLRPPIEHVKAAEESYKSLLLSAESQLHLNLGEQTQSGVAKEIDLRLNDDFLNKIGGHVADSITISLKFMLAYYNNKSFDDNNTEFQLPRPSNYRLKTSAELIKELIDLKTGNAPAMLIAAVSRQLASLRFSGDTLNEKIFKIITTYDPLYLYSVMEKQSMTMTNLSKRDDVTISNYIYSTLLNMAEEMGVASFIATEPQKLFEDYLVKVKPHLIEMTPLVDPNGNAE